MNLGASLSVEMISNVYIFDRFLAEMVVIYLEVI